MLQKVIIFDARFNGELKRLAIQASKEESYWVGIVLLRGGATIVKEIPVPTKV